MSVFFFISHGSLNFRNYHIVFGSVASTLGAVVHSSAIFTNNRFMCCACRCVFERMVLFALSDSWRDETRPRKLDQRLSSSSVPTLRRIWNDFSITLSTRLDAASDDRGLINLRTNGARRLGFSSHGLLGPITNDAISDTMMQIEEPTSVYHK